MRMRRGVGTRARGDSTDGRTVRKRHAFRFLAALDTCRVLPRAGALDAWREDAGAETLAALRNRFVTGDWAEGQKRAEARPAGSDGESGSGSEDDEVRARRRPSENARHR
jgi:hypothetical protein